MKHTNVRKYQGNNKLFLTACELAGITPTIRQWRKWQQGRGLATQKRQEAQELVKVGA